MTESKRSVHLGVARAALTPVEEATRRRNTIKSPRASSLSRVGSLTVELNIYRMRTVIFLYISVAIFSYSSLESKSF